MYRTQYWLCHLYLIIILVKKKIKLIPNIIFFCFQEIQDINGTSVRLFLLEDPAYPLTDWLMKGYTRSPSLTPEQESLNAYLSCARTTIEMEFGRLKSRWRVLLKRCDFHYKFSPYAIATCCALHNFCEGKKETFHPIWSEEVASLEKDFPQPGIRNCSVSECSGAQAIRRV